MSGLLQDIRYALRQLRKNPGFTAIAVLMLALAIGANTAIFSLVNAALFKLVGVDHPNQLVSVFFGDDRGHGLSNHSYADYLDYRNQSGDVLSGLAAYTTVPANLVINQATERVNVGLVSDNYFSVLGVKQLAGCACLHEQTNNHGDFSAVISESLWRRKFDGSRDLIGRTVWLNGANYSVIGVVPEQSARMAQIVKIDVFIPASMEAVLGGDKDFLSNRQNKEFMVVGRLRPGVSREQAQAKFSIIAAELQKQFPEAWTEDKHAHNLSLVPYTHVPFELRGLVVGFAGLLMAGVTGVLLIACNNLANFLLARGLTKKKEFAVRLSLGANRWRLIRQLLMESLTIAFLGGVLGFLFAIWAEGFLAKFAPNIGVPLAIDLTIDGRVLAYSIVLTLVTAITFGLLPSLKASELAPSEGLKETGQQMPSKRGTRMRNLLMVGQISASLVLLMCAGAFLSGVFKLRSVDLGFDPHNLSLLTVNPSTHGYSAEQSEQVIKQAVERLRALPGVLAVSVAGRVPIGLSSIREQILPFGATYSAKPIFIGSNSIGTDYFETMRTALLRGRAIDSRDREGTQSVAVVNEVLATSLWPGQEPIGKHIQTSDGKIFEVVGVAKVGKYDSLGEAPLPFVYFSLDQRHGYRSELTFHIRTRIAPGALLNLFQRELLRIDSALASYDVETMNAHLADSLLLVRMGTTLLGIFGALGLSLATIGLYGLMAYLVRQRTSEMGIRLALGASPGDVVKLMVKQGMNVTFVGIAIGLIFGATIAFVIANQLYGASPMDIAVLATVVSVQLAVALLACWVPARRAAKVDPMVVLRYE